MALLGQGETNNLPAGAGLPWLLRDHDLITVGMSKQKSDIFSNMTGASKNRNNFLALKKIVCNI